MAHNFNDGKGRETKSKNRKPVPCFREAIWFGYMLLGLLSYSLVEAQNINATDSIEQDAHCIILDEFDQISIGGSRFNFMNLVFSKKVTVKILDTLGAQNYSHITIPELHDRHIPQQAPEIRNIRPEFQFTRVISLRYWINGKEKTEPKVISGEILRVLNNRFAISDVTSYIIEGLDVGDVLTYHYQVEVPYRSNWEYFMGYRVFFHGQYPKKKYQFKLTVPKSLLIDIYQLNRTKCVKTENGKILEYDVVLKNLPGCINEIGARAYRDLPHITFRPKPYEWQYLPYNTDLGKFMPFHLAIGKMRERAAEGIQRQFSIGTNNPDMNKARRFVNALTPDYYGMKSGEFMEAHGLIANKFDFLDDREYFSEYDTRLARVGQHLLNRKLRDINRYNTYLHLFASLNINYNTLYPCDSRFGIIGKHYLNSMVNNDYLYLISLDSTSYIIYPKKSRIGYHLNEVPFYFENTAAIRINLNDLYFGRDATPTKKMSLMRIPRTPPSKNTRRIDVDVKVSDVGADFFKAKVALGGQYSTNNRHAYTLNMSDHTINSDYGKRISDLPSVGSDISIEVLTKSDVKPFSFSCTTEYSAPISSTNGNTITINLSHLFPHITDSETIEHPRFLPYYPDFMQKDVISYYFQLEQACELGKHTSFEISNSYGDYSFSSTMQSPTLLRVSSVQTISTEKVKAKDIEGVMEILKAIDSANSSVVILRKL